MNKWLFLLLGCFSLMYAQIRQYFVVRPTRQMKLVLESTQRIEREIQNLSKIFKETFKKFPDNLLYTPHSFTQDVSWFDLERALLETRLYLYKESSLEDEITDPYESYEHPAVSVFNIRKKDNAKIWLKEIRELLEYIKDSQRKGIPERERPRGYYYPTLPQSSIYHPSVAARRWQAQRPERSSVIEAEQRISELD